MLKKLWRTKKGQIQGVDFALAMIIFMIMFAEVVVLTLSFIQPKYQNLNDRVFETKAQQIADSFFDSAGLPNYWEYNLTSEFNSFGLKDISSSALDPNKISRIRPGSLYAISYDNLLNNLSQEQEFGFQLTIDSLFFVNSSLTISPPTANIEVVTTTGNCIIWNFVVAPSGEVIYTNRSLTNSLGIASESFSISAPLPQGFYTLVTFAKSIGTQFAIDIAQLTVGTSSDLGLQMLVQEEETNNGKIRVHSQNSGSLSSLKATILYPYASGNAIFGNDSSTISSPTTAEIFSLRVPTNGSSVILLTGETATGEFSRISYTFPALLNEDFITIFGQFFVPQKEDLVKIEQLVLIRECIFKAVLYIWLE